MNHREQAFRNKFADAATHLGAAPEQLASLKIRENVGGYEEYHELLHALEHHAGIRSRSVQGDFQGNGYLVEQSKTKVVIVEHETGLEVLYIAGSIASLLSLIPLILRCWSVVRGDGRHRPPDFRQVEMRRLGDNGRLVEDRKTGLDVPWAAPLSIMNTVLISAAETIDGEIQGLRLAVQKAAKRIDTLEKTIAGIATASHPAGHGATTRKRRKG
jgi:hypothetical protein